MSRSFTIVKSDVKIPDHPASEQYGRYMSSSPYNAAPKAARALFQHTSKKTIRLTLKETTQGSKNNLYTYTAVKTKLDKPVVVSLGNSQVTIKNQINIKSCRTQ